jgi:hypothetical protein
MNEVVAINLKNNAHIFLTFIISKEVLHSKNNLQTSINNAQRNEEDVFSKDFAIVENDNDILRSRALNLRKKASTLTKQTDFYEKMINQMNLARKSSLKKTAFSKHEMIYIEDVLTLS